MTSSLQLCSALTQRVANVVPLDAEAIAELARRTLTRDTPTARRRSRREIATSNQTSVATGRQCQLHATVRVRKVDVQEGSSSVLICRRVKETEPTEKYLIRSRKESMPAVVTSTV